MFKEVMYFIIYWTMQHLKIMLSIIIGVHHSIFLLIEQSDTDPTATYTNTCDKFQGLTNCIKHCKIIIKG